MKFSNNDRDKIYDDRFEYDDVPDQYVDSKNNFDEYSYDEDIISESPKKKKSKKGIKKLIKILLAATLCMIIGTVAIGLVMSFILPAKTNFLIMATDEGGTRTDTLMLGVFDKKTKAISLVSIPRDSYVTVSDETYARMNEEYPQPGSKSMKINAVHHFGGEKYGTDMVVEQVEALIGTKVNFYVKIDIEAFKYIVDSVGGIDFYVPQNMEYYDPVQNLRINLQEGNQHLNGDQAEQVVRFRSGYANADLGRVSVQQQFVKAFISQALSPKTIISSPGTYLNVMFRYNYVETDINILDVVAYAFVIGGINSEKIESYTLPGYAAYEGGQSVYKVDSTKTQALFDSIYSK